MHFHSSRSHDLKQSSGFTIIEALVFLFLFSLITSVFFQTFASGTALIQQSKHRLGAVALANQKMEIIRSLDYENIGTTTGVPSGDLLEDESVQVNNTVYEVHTFVQYVDDSFDGTLGGSPNDLVPNDYKRIRLEVSWGGGSDAERIAVATSITQQGMEQATGGGILSINILDSEGNGVSGASVRIVNGAVSPAVDVTTSTDASGNLFLIGAPASTQGYQVTFSKSGYYGSASYAPYPTSSFNPTDVHASVVDAVVNQATYVMDQEVDLQLSTEDPLGNDIPDIDFRIDGGRQIGTVAGSSPAQPVYSFGADGATDGSGERTYAGESYGTYTWTLDPSESGYTFIRLDPDSASGVTSFQALPNATASIKMILADNAVPALLVTVTDAADGTPITGASVRLVNTTLGYDETVATSLYGKAYFPTSGSGLVPDNYDLEVSASGYTTENDTLTVGGSLEEASISLTAS